MDWIKKHYEQCALALLALVLLICSVLLILRAQDFGSAFSAAMASAPTREKVPPLVLDRIEEARKTLQAPPQWNEAESRMFEADGKTKKRGSLFVSDRYVVGKDGTPKKPGDESFYTDTLTGKPIKNVWFMDYNLPLLDPEVRSQDPDKDGFANEDEWRADTDPIRKESHPPYHTKLFVKQFIREPFRLVFEAYDGDPKKPRPDKDGFQINTKDLKQPSEFLKIGETVSNTNFKLEKFEYKEQVDQSTGEKKDISELTVINTETKARVVLVLNRMTDSPNFSMKFIYKWESPAREFIVKKGGIFGLKPNVKDVYKLIDSQEGKAQIQTPDGQQIWILPDPRDKK